MPLANATGSQGIRRPGATSSASHTRKCANGVAPNHGRPANRGNAGPYPPGPRGGHVAAWPRASRRGLMTPPVHATALARILPDGRITAASPLRADPRYATPVASAVVHEPASDPAALWIVVITA